jgi:hypothetical protein
LDDFVSVGALYANLDESRAKGLICDQIPRGVAKINDSLIWCSPIALTVIDNRKCCTSVGADFNISMDGTIISSAKIER